MVLKNYRTLATTQTWDGTAQTVITQLPRDFLAQRYIIDMNSPAIKSHDFAKIHISYSLFAKGRD